VGNRAVYCAAVFALRVSCSRLGSGLDLYALFLFPLSNAQQEVGIRMALGAPRVSILRLVISSTAIMLAAGVGVGLALSLLWTTLLRSWAGRRQSARPVTLLLSALILITVATIACAVPAWRAATVNPVVALRYE